ncbi:MAG TPA: hypothetical protein VG387_02585 [Rhizomicrobium sp.]|jgi:hypothetical protein|nr:hypothetical protein [Rhizomicrobium sp.]
MAIALKDLYEYVRGRMAEHGDFEHKLFGYTPNNKILTASKSLFDTPQDYWQKPDADFPEKTHSDRLPDAMCKIIADGKTFVDIVTMDEPKGKFRAAYEDGIAAIAKAGHKATIRILLGRQFSPFHLEIEMMLWQLAAKLPVVDGLVVYMAQFRSRNNSWNHAKLIAVDGNAILTGGHNMWDQDYLEAAPTFDISMRFDGEIALGGHFFADGIWKYVANVPEGNRHITYCRSLRVENGKWVVKTEHAPQSFGLPRGGDGDTPALWVTAPGLGVWNTHTGTGMIALVRALQSAEKLCYLSLQDLASDYVGGSSFVIEQFVDFPYQTINCQGYIFILPLVDAMAAFLRKNRDTQLCIVLSHPKGDGRPYTSGCPFGVILDVIGQRMRAQDSNLTPENIAERMRGQLFLQDIRFDKNRLKWPDGRVKRNHAKFWMMDDRLFYVGSDNVYPYVKPGPLTGAHPEFGIVAEPTDTARDELLNTYWRPLFQWGDRIVPNVSYFTWK